MAEADGRKRLLLAARLLRELGRAPAACWHESETRLKARVKYENVHPALQHSAVNCRYGSQRTGRFASEFRELCWSE